MSFTMTRSATESFTLTHAKYLASKVTADMKRCQLRYGRPSDDQINNYGTELALLLRDGYVAEYEFGFKRADQERIVSWHYKVDSSGGITTDERPGGIYADAVVASASLFNFLTPSAKWNQLDGATQQRIEEGLPFQRTAGSPPKDGLGYWVSDRTYSSTGVSLGRKTFHPFSTS